MLMASFNIGVSVMLQMSLVLALGLAVAVPLAIENQSDPPDLSDPEVAHAAVTANTIDADLGALAESRATDVEVKRFAAMMHRDHKAVNARAAALAKKLGVTPKDNAVSQSLMEGAAAARAKIEPLKGVAFERAYIEREIAYHQAVLDALDQVLIPTTENPELKQLLTDVRPAIAVHLQLAKKIGEKQK